MQNKQRAGNRQSGMTAAQTQTQLGIIQQKSNGQNQSTKLINYFYSSKNTEADKRQSDGMTQKIHNTYGDVFNGIGCLVRHVFVTA